jgi:hypothetical protein
VSAMTRFSPLPQGAAAQLELCRLSAGSKAKLCELEAKMHGLIYLIGLIVVILAILSFFGLR